MSNQLTITVNGAPHVVEATPDTPLLYVLRNELELNGPLFGCGLEQCGACMVLRGAEAVKSCVLPVGEVAGSQITTLEGLGTRDEPHPESRRGHGRRRQNPTHPLCVGVKTSLSRDAYRMSSMYTRNDMTGSVADDRSP